MSRALWSTPETVAESERVLRALTRALGHVPMHVESDDMAAHWFMRGWVARDGDDAERQDKPT